MERINIVEQGAVKSFDHVKRTGFITRERGPEVFFSDSSFIDQSLMTLAEGGRVSFEVVRGPKMLQAKNMSKIDSD